MNIKILDSWLREYVETPASVKEIANALSLTSVGVEHIDKIGNDFVYDIEVTTNRPDLMSVIGIARETQVVLNQFGIQATFKSPKITRIRPTGKKADIEIKNDPSLVNRILAIVLEVDMKKSPEMIQRRLESSDIRSLNNIIDVTNYVMRETGHPAHVFDYDRLTTKKLVIRKSKPGEQVTTLDEKLHTLSGGDIVADNGTGEIVDMLGIMGTANSVVTKDTKRILFFLDNNNPHRIRKTSMGLGIRTEAAVLNEKGIDPELMEEAFYRGIELYKEIADAKIISDPVDIYPNKPKPITITANTDKIRQIIGVEIPDKQIKTILENLGFRVLQNAKKLTVDVPSWRLGDVAIEEDIIEEVARIYGYHNLPSTLPPINTVATYHQDTDPFYWEQRIKNAMKYWGFTETYTYSMVSSNLYEGNPDTAVKIKNPLDEEHVYMRQTLVPSLLEVTRENTDRDRMKLFEISNIYIPRKNELPRETQHLALVIQKPNVSFFEMKGYIEALLSDLSIENGRFTFGAEGVDGAEVYIGQEKIGAIEILDTNTIDAELDFEKLLAHATLSKKLAPIAKHPPVIEDIRVLVDPSVSYAQIIDTISKQSTLIRNVELIDTYEDKKTFRITYQDLRRNLTNEDVTDIRNKVIKELQKELKAKIA